MPLLAALLQGLFGALAVWLGRWFGIQVAGRLAAVGTMFTLMAALMAAFNAAVAPLAAAAFSTQYGQVLGLAFPPAAGTCLATYAALWAGCALYAHQRAAARMLAG